MPPYVMRLLAKGHKLIKVNENTFMIKRCGYFLINLSKKEIKSVVKKPDVQVQNYFFPVDVEEGLGNVSKKTNG